MISIDKGIKVHFIKEKKFKRTIICILIRRNLNREEVTFNSMIPNILKRCSFKYNSIKKINSELENMYGTIFDAQILKIGEEHILQFYLDILDKNIDNNLLDKALKFLSEIILNPYIEESGFNKKILDIEKENLKNKIESHINDKYTYIKGKCIENVCKEEPFSIYKDGYIEDLEKINNVNLYKHYINILKNSPIEFIILGNEEEDSTVNIIKKYFNFKNREKILPIKKPNIIYKEKKIEIIKENLNINQGKICIAVRSSLKQVGKDFYNFLVLNEILGGGANSKLFVKIREKENLCYSICSFIFRFKSIMLIESGVEKENFDKTINLIKEEIENIKNGNIEIEELEKAKESIIRNFMSTKDCYLSIINFYLYKYILEDKDEIKDIIKKISEITKEDIINSSKRMYIDTIYLLY